MHKMVAGRNVGSSLALPKYHLHASENVSRSNPLPDSRPYSGFRNSHMKKIGEPLAGKLERSCHINNA